MTVDTYGRMTLSREGGVFRLAFKYNPSLLDRVKRLPYAAFDPETKTWTCSVCVQALELLRQWRWEGMVDVDPDSLVEPAEQLEAIKLAVLRSGSAKRPFLVHTAMRDDELYRRLIAIPGARWERNANAVSYPAHSATALAELVDKGVVEDSGRLLQPAAVTVAFDARLGQFKVRGDERAQRSFSNNFPHKDVFSTWVERGLDVAFADTFSEEMYRGEIARHGEGVQPAGMKIDLYPYQRVDVAVALERSGLGVWHGMGVGKCLRGDVEVWAGGSWVAIETLWDTHASENVVWDGEGEWATIDGSITVLSALDDGSIAERSASRLYRQRVTEELRRVTLADGARVVITFAHQLLTSHGWARTFDVGDLVAVPGAGGTVDWQPVVGVETVRHDGWVFDLEVPETHNFVAGGMVCHNTALAIGAAHELLNNRNAVSRVVVVVPPALRTQWRDEIVRFTGADPSDVVVIDGDKKKRLEQYALAATKPWLVVHYQAIILPEDHKKLGNLVSGALLVMDEAHRAKNAQAKVSKVCKEFAQKAARRVLLSGTPVENNPGEWFNLLSGLVYPGVFGSPIDFLNRYSYAGKFGGYEGARNIPELRNRSKPLYVRRTLNDVAEWLPKLRVQTIHLDPRPEYAAALRRAHREAAEEIKAMRMDQMDKTAKRTGEILDGAERDEVAAGAEMTATGLLKLLCCSPRIVLDSESDSADAMRSSGLIPEEDGPKIDELRVMCAEMQAHSQRVVVFTGSKRMANLVAERMTEDGIRHVLFTGDTNRDDRDAAVKAFTTAATDDNPGPTVFISTDAGAEGLNLGRCCSTLVNLDIPWTPGRLAQRNARVRRVDSTADSFLIVNLVLRSTIEEGILRMVEHKADLADAILGEAGGRKATTGRGGRNVFETALAEWEQENPDQKRSKKA